MIWFTKPRWGIDPSGVLTFEVRGFIDKFGRQEIARCDGQFVWLRRERVL